MGQLTARGGSDRLSPAQRHDAPTLPTGLQSRMREAVAGEDAPLAVREVATRGEAQLLSAQGAFLFPARLSEGPFVP